MRAAEIAGPGFLNLRLSEAPFHAIVREVLAAGRAYGRAAAATGERVLVEFVSANPTGPLLVSHARGALLGDAVARLLEAAGNRVVREYYVNDFGNQVRLLGESVRAMVEGREPPEGGYAADYVRELAAWAAEHAKEALADPDPAALARAAVTRMLDGVPGSRVLPGIKRTLANLGVVFDVWTSEESLHRWGRVAAALEDLGQKGALEERDGALFFKSESEGDDKDRVVRKRDGAYTYFASDIAYHADKIARGFDRLVDVWGADHHGYVARVRGALSALGLAGERFEVLLYQLVFLLRNGEPVKMGKRLGNIVTIEEVVEEIDEAAGRKGAGADALRFFYLSRRSDTTVDFDIEVAKKSSLDNPVFYLQYGYARATSLLGRAKNVFHVEPGASLAKLTHPDELAIAARLGRFPRVVREAAKLLRAAPDRLLPPGALAGLPELLHPAQGRRHPAAEEAHRGGGLAGAVGLGEDAGPARVGRGHPHDLRRGPRPAGDHGARADGSRRHGEGRRGRRRGDGSMREARDVIDGSSVRNIDEIQERDPGSPPSRAGALVLASLGGACIVFASALLLRSPPKAKVQSARSARRARGPRAPGRAGAALRTASGRTSRSPLCSRTRSSPRRRSRRRATPRARPGRRCRRPPRTRRRPRPSSCRPARRRRRRPRPTASPSSRSRRRASSGARRRTRPRPTRWRRWPRRPRATQATEAPSGGAWRLPAPGQLVQDAGPTPTPSPPRCAGAATRPTSSPRR